MSGPPPSITIVVSCVSDDERGRYRGPGVSRGRNGLENHHFLVHIPQLRTKKLLTQYRRDPRGRPQYRRQGERSFRGDIVSWGYFSWVDFVASSKKKRRTSSLKEIPRSWTTRAKGSPYEPPGGSLSESCCV